MRSVWILLISFAFLCDACVKYDFEEGFDELFGFPAACSRIVAARWSRMQYWSGFPAPHSLSRSYITPAPGVTSCTSTFPFQMHAGGLLEINVYMQTNNNVDRITASIYRPTSSGADELVATASVSRLDSSYKPGMNTLNVTLSASMDTFEGYVVLTGTRSSSSNILIDSFRYIAPGSDESKCVMYEQNPTAETSSTTVNPASSTLGPTASSCETYQFGVDFEDKFNNDGQCNFLGNWIRSEELPAGVPKFNSNSDSHISPEAFTSCTSSHIFTMRSDGHIELNIYMVPGSNNFVDVTIYEIEGSSTRIVSNAGIPETQTLAKPAWTTLKLSLGPSNNGFKAYRTFSGYITIMGRAASGNPVLVDSFRYYAPDDEKENCVIYEEDATCTTYQFGDDFENKFSSNGICSNIDEWTRSKNLPSHIPKFHPNSNSFITNEKRLTCASSFTFPMRSDGHIELNYFIDGTEGSVLVMVHIDDGGIKIINQVEANGDTNKAWKILKIPIANDIVYDSSASTYNGFIVIMGRGLGADVLVDSFKYHSPTEDDENSCVIYDEGTACITYQFGSDFVDRFEKDKNAQCKYLEDWNRKINPVNVVGFHPSDDWSISPAEFPSCTSSFTFPMRTDGLVEVNFYMEASSETDYLQISVIEVNGQATRTVNEGLFKESTNGSWSTLSIALNPGKNNVTTFNGYITIRGRAAVNSIVLVDSFRYYAMDEESNDSCVIYEYVEDIGCMTYKFNDEKDYNTRFERNGYCNMLGEWKWKAEAPSIPGVPGLGSHIYPEDILSCISSFSFPMRTDGFVEVNLFMDGKDPSDVIEVTVYKTDGEYIDVVNVVTRNTSTDNNLQPIEIALHKMSSFTYNDDSTKPVEFRGYVTIKGRASSKSVVLIDSFRYFTPDEKEACKLKTPEDNNYHTMDSTHFILGE